jgi:glycosyltransferase involved in cell wall biosynthesis
VIGLVMRDLSGSGGMERVHSELIRRLSERFQFVVASHTIDPDLSELVTWRRIPIIRRPAVVAMPLFFAVGSVRVKQLDVDILHTCGAIVGNRAQISTVHFCHAGFRLANGGLAPKEAPLDRRLNTTLMRTLAIAAEKWCYRGTQTHVLGAVSRQVEDELEKHYKGTRVVVTPNGVDVAAFRPEQRVREESRAKRGVTPDELVALFVGGDWDRKGLAIAIRAIAEAHRLGAGVRLWVVGQGDEDRFRRLAIDLGVGDLVDFIGADREPSRWYRGADLFLVCSIYETFSLAMVEAAAAGLPLITTAVGVAQELVRGDPSYGVGGVVVERNSMEFGRVIAELSANESARLRMGAVALDRAQAFSWEQVTERMADVYTDILATEPRTLSSGKHRRYFRLSREGRREF